ncbi:PQQ-binding-like beta-propeller repeat protein [Micromonospora sp. WMMD1120]|uniref:outer membrane protein assembly factor BamB family protein n=1 Tax=Micromonospora sp. WMMD1120 TaxID=3016106 RepID=UPI002416AF20|nr:PQQ-binding-like beta-propeller repeat protein [Micromonospora sp. WMMD1120]MDG4806582.1 PQQ-binding-like beta-propeller repeat protein [Micromonospora sp. WMMD1120]
MGFPRGRRRLVVTVAALLATVAAAAVVHRVLAPAEVSTVARAEYPAAPQPSAGVVGRLPAAPLIVDARLRVFAAHRQVYADRPANGRYRTSPFWSYRRWPAELSGVVASGRTVISRWSDGRVVALDASTGRVLWRADGPVPPTGDAAVRRTGAATVWDPPGLYRAGLPGGRTVLVVTGDRQARGIELAGGRELWRVELPGSCRGDVGTTVTGQLVGLDTCAGPAAVEFRDAATGAVRERWRPAGAPDALVVTPLGCRTGRSECPALRTAGPGDAGGRGWLVGAGGPVPAAALDPAGATVVGEEAVTVLDGTAVGRSARSGTELWRFGGLGPAARVLAAQPGRVHLLTQDNDLVTLDPATGTQLSRFRMNVGSDGTGWSPGAVATGDGYVAVERLRRPVDPDAEDLRYFLSSEPVILAVS